MAPSTGPCTFAHVRVREPSLTHAGGWPLALAICATLIASPRINAQTTIAGRVIDRRVGSSIAAATIRAGTRSATTDTSGQFVLEATAQDTLRLRIRRMGYAPVDTLVDLRATDRRRLLFALAPLPLRLDTVAVKARGEMAGVIEEFEERRRHGLGRYITRDELRKNDDRMLAEVLRGRMPGLGFLPRSGRIWLFSPAENGLASICYTSIYLDGMPLFRLDDLRKGKEPPDFNLIFTREYDAVEYYAHPSSAPVQYRNEGARCGILMLWSRRR